MKAKWDDLTNTEKYILDIIIQNMEKIKKYNMEELAKFTNSSLGSISRLYNKLGYDSYKVFKNEFYSFKKIKKEISINELKINEIIEKNKREINLTISYLEIEFIKKLAKKMHYSNRIFIYGQGLSSFVCEYAARKLQIVGKNAFSFYDDEIIKNNTENASANDVIIVISLGGQNKPILDSISKLSMQFLSKNVFLITGNGKSPIGKIISQKQIVYKEPSVLKTKDLQSRIQLEIVIRIVVDYFIIQYINN